ncbi:protein FAM135B-like isoform X4 [Vigna unguiculata]|uniref:protein FAM135B-like isoform X4 n=1 Tax=Vigna unguiculata TaxID=3917 RepID=UPI001016B432|nr:protein FAM135B-like isoform X4 [Vigna unguiculata]
MPPSVKVKSEATLETVQEIAVYLHRFHNLDLFKQGWYQIKITVRWEDSENVCFGIPASIVQYEVPPDLDPSSIYGVWRIDDTDNSFSTQSFRIKYARQDVHLDLMIVFNLRRNNLVDLATTAVILKFELIYAPMTEHGVELDLPLDASSAAIHEFRIPPKALVGLHSYCPVHFDALHAVLVDVSVHASILKVASHSFASKLPSNSANTEVIADQSSDTSNKGSAVLVKVLSASRDILLEELQKIGRAINEALDFSEFVSIVSNMKQENQLANEVIGQGKPHNGRKFLCPIVQGGNEDLDFQDVEKFCSLSQNELMDCFHSLGDQLSYLWKTFLKFHRDNKTKIMGVLHETWIRERKTEWSIWMLYSKVEMPHQYTNSKGDETSQRTAKRAVSLWKLPDDPIQIAATRAELHRKSIEQMRINNRSIQDMQIFGDPLRTPIVIVEHVLNVPRRFPSENSLLRHIGHIDSDGFPLSLNYDSIAKKFAQPNSIMEPFLSHLHTYVSVSGPHLGYLYSSNSLFNSGLWFLKKLKGTQCIHQLTFTDDPDIQNTFLYKLCQQKTLEHFRNIILLSSPQDGYVPYHSARIESCQAASRDTSKKSKLFMEMLNACMDQIRANSTLHRVFMRCDVNFDPSTQGKNLDSIIGRAAHIEFLDSDIFAKFIMWSFPDLFR